MAPTLVATVGSASANSFVSQADATLYLDTRLNTGAWISASTADKDRALISATSRLNRLPWIGTRVDSTQALQWPRLNALRPDPPADVSGDDYWYADDEIPDLVVQATCELALELLRAGTTDLMSKDAQAGVIREKVDVLETEWAAPYFRATGLAAYPNVVGPLVPLLNVGAGQMTIARG